MGKIFFVVRDESLKQMYDATFVKYLEEHRYKKDENSKGWDNRCDWIWIDIVNKTYWPAIPGIKIGTVIGNHCITIEEFKQINRIYFKYENLDFLNMTLREQIENNFGRGVKK